MPPTSVTEPTPRTFSSRFLTTWSAIVVRSRKLRCLSLASLVTEIEKIGRSAGSKRVTRGSLTSLRNGGLDQRDLFAHVLRRLRRIDGRA